MASRWYFRSTAGLCCRGQQSTGTSSFPSGISRSLLTNVAGGLRRGFKAVDLSGLGDRYPWQLSGGMQQRVAIARALAYQPKLLLMDQPFASVDAQTRADLEDLVAAVRDQFGITIVLVTHDIDESVLSPIASSSFPAHRVPYLRKSASTFHDRGIRSKRRRCNSL